MKKLPRPCLRFLCALSLFAFLAGAVPDSAAAAAFQKVKAGPFKSKWDDLVEAAKKEGSLVVAPTSIGEAAQVSARAFKEKYGIKIEHLSGRSVEVARKVAAERSAGLYLEDVMHLGLSSYFTTIKSLRITQPLEPLLILPEVLDKSKWRLGNIPFADKDKTIIAASLNRMHHIAINTETVKDGEITSMEDVLAPKWKGKIVINNPSVNGPGFEWFKLIMLKAYGMEKGREYMRRLIGQEPVIIRDERLQVEWVARGKYPIGLGLTTAQTNRVARTGAPIKTLAMKEGQHLSSGSMNLVVFDNAPHPNAAKLYVNWVLSREGAEIMQKYSSYLSARRDVSTAGFDPTLVPDSQDVLATEEEYFRAGELLKVAAEIFKDLIR